MKKIIALSLLLIISCNSEKDQVKEDSKDSVKIDSSKTVIEKPKNYKSAHQEHYEEFKKDSSKKR